MLANSLELASAIFLSVLAIITVISNGLLLVAIWKDPLKCFKTAATYFVVGLSLADIITGLTVEPFFATYYFMHYFQGNKALKVASLYQAGSTISSVAICYSFLIVLALSWSQFIAIRWPHKYKTIVTKRNVIAFIFASFLYLLAFTLTLQYTGLLDEVTFLKLQLALHASFLSVNLMVISLLLFFAFRHRVSSRAASASTRNNAASKQEKIERQFTAVAMYLAAILLLAALPHVCTAQLYLYLEPSVSPEVKSNLIIALRVSDLLLFLKVCLDPFVYAWRLPPYRRTLHEIFGCHGNQRAKSGSDSPSGSLLAARQVVKKLPTVEHSV